ncbi:thialysine N-epsilon-acetyltransferase-like [Pectinophora gossypiella]|uniref:thialysine N-epsilon-acetyltransferase-like n=1 Tax=Pectinophora gossypiella TaxID=13191 RepID=UPI00214E9CCA|nr:thialysine N-epsilon-acetyltransferase-like [Pectinophora gossypiella]
MSGEKFTDNEIQVRPAKKEDMVAVAEMIQELADFEKMPEGPKLSLQDLERDGFESKPSAFSCKVAELQEGRGAPSVVGYALYFPTYSTWEGRAMMLEDLYVRPAVRRRGVGHKLFDSVAKEAHTSGCSRLDFHVLEWNDARSFYESKGAVNLTNKEQWCYYRLSGGALEQAANMGKPI